MKKITLFMFESCPHCQYALDLQDELKREHPEYARIPFEMIDELLEPELADRFDYYWVPTYYVGGKKVHEGHAEKKDIERVYKLAMK